MSACFTIDDCIGIVKKKSFWKKIYRECLDWLSYWVPTLFENSRQFLLGSRLLRQQLTKKKNKLAIAKSFLPIDNSIYKLCKFETKSIQNKAGKWLKKKKTKNRSMNGAKKKNANTIDAHILLDFWPFCLRLRLVVFSEQGFFCSKPQLYRLSKQPNTTTTKTQLVRLTQLSRYGIELFFFFQSNSILALVFIFFSKPICVISVHLNQFCIAFYFVFFNFLKFFFTYRIQYEETKLQFVDYRYRFLEFFFLVFRFSCFGFLFWDCILEKKNTFPCLFFAFINALPIFLGVFKSPFACFFFWLNIFQKNLFFCFPNALTSALLFTKFMFQF